MSNDYTADLVTFVSDDGEEIEFEVLDTIENEDGKFYILYPYYEDPADAVNDPGEYYIFQAEEIDGEEEFVELEDEALLDKIDTIFRENNKDLFEE
ncbi:MAG: DUF1292 domain-containing protein [Ruminococcus sp.]|nr:DUF1292 domain-containing protein [Ruminococcus sp.]